MFGIGRSPAKMVPILLLLAVLIGFVSVDGVVLVQAQDDSYTCETPAECACATTPDMTDGQGLRSSRFGLRSSRFELEISGLGLRSSRFGLRSSRFEALMDEITDPDNLINDPDKPSWLSGLLAEVGDDSKGFNLADTAVIIADDFSTEADDSHGYKVERIVQALLDEADATRAAAGKDPLNIQIVEVDLSDGANPYRMDTTIAKIDGAISDLQAAGVERVTINLSWGLIPCEDPGDPDRGFPPFNFYDFLETYNEVNQNVPQPVEPILECVRQVSNNQYEAIFGYNNHNATPVSISIGTDNLIAPKPEFQGQPRLFETGRQHHVFSVLFSKNKEVSWSLGGTYGGGSAAANKNSTPCDTAAEPAEILPITPTVCVVENVNGSFTARFGYNNPNESALTLPVDDTLTIKVGGRNRFSPTPFDRGQTISFLPGEHVDVFEVLFDGSDLEWIINSAPNGGDEGKNSVIANADSPGCVSSDGFGLMQYITDQLDVPLDLLGEYMAYLSEKAAELDTDELKAYLAKLAADNVTEESFRSIVAAATGNYRELFGPAAVAPAKYLSTAGIGASTDHSENLTIYTHDGNIVAPGSWYWDWPLPPKSTDEPEAILVGTSFSSPRAAFIGALWLSYAFEDTCIFDGVHPPLIDEALYDSDNQPPGAAPNMPLLSGYTMPFNCVPNSPPELTNPGDRTGYVGEVVLLQIEASDPDADAVLTFGAEGLPPNLSIDANTGEISGTLAVADIGAHNVTVSVTDDRGSTVSASFVWTVVPNLPPVITNPGDQTGHVGDVVSLQVEASDPDGDDLTFSAVGLPPALNISAAGLIGGTLTDMGTYYVTVSVMDEHGSSASANFVWMVGPPVIHVVIDIKPGSYPNTINLGSHGVVSVAILSSNTFDATLIDSITVELANAGIRFHGQGNSGKIRDVDGDNRDDLVVHVETEALDLTSNDVEATLTAEMYDGRSVESTDTVRIVPGKAPNLLAPSDGTATTSRTPLLTWEPVPSAKCYLVQVDDNASFSSPDEATVVGGEEYSAKKLPFGQYYWRAQVGGTCNIDPSPWSEVWSFTVTR